jgi:hypothetical protein
LQAAIPNNQIRSGDTKQRDCRRQYQIAAATKKHMPPELFDTVGSEKSLVD